MRQRERERAVMGEPLHHSPGEKKRERQRTRARAREVTLKERKRETSRQISTETTTDSRLGPVGLVPCLSRSLFPGYYATSTPTAKPH